MMQRRRKILCWMATTIVFLTVLRSLRNMDAVVDNPLLRRDRHVQEILLKKEGGNENYPLQQVQKSQVKRLVVLILSSLPRSGSTLLSRMFSTLQDSIVIYEPLWITEKNTTCYMDEDEACIQRHMTDVLSCSFSEDFETWLKGKGTFFQFFSEQARHCNAAKDKETCLKEMDLKALCKRASVLIVKVIRARMSWIPKLLQDPKLEFKLIHLIRDPRASLNSIRKFGWPSDPHTRCNGFEDDLLTYDKMRQMYPSKVMQVRLEYMCLSPLKTLRNIFNFLFENSTVPNGPFQFVQRTMLAGISKNSQISTKKNSSEEYQNWRIKISEDYLKAIEEEPSCLRSILHLGHALFGSHSALTNFSNPLIINPI